MYNCVFYFLLFFSRIGWKTFIKGTIWSPNVVIFDEKKIEVKNIHYKKKAEVKKPNSTFIYLFEMGLIVLMMMLVE